MKKRSNSYWDKRSQQRMAAYHRSADKTVKTVTEAYDKAVKDLTAEIDSIFERFGRDGQISPDEAKELLNAPLPRAEWDALKASLSEIKDSEIRQRVLNRLNAPAYAARITRLQALREQAYIRSKIIADVELAASTKGYIDIINDAYYRNMFDLHRGLGIGFDFAGLPTRTVETILKRPWSGEHYSKRIWGNTDVLAKQLGEVITGGFMSGADVRRMRKEIEERANVGMHAANRLIRTETTYMANAAEMESYEEAEIERYQFLATLDSRTSPMCRKHDLKVYDVKDAEPGKNMPPLHPYCRSTTVAYFGDEELENLERRARDPETGESVTVPANTDYEKWREDLGKQHGKDRIDIIEKQLRNQATDKEQFDKYKIIFKEELGTKTLADFQNLKYTNSKEWERLKQNKQKVLSGLDYNESMFGKFGDLESRQWYISHDEDIINKIDTSKPLREQAIQAHGLRNKYRTEARLMMKDRKAAENLDVTHPHWEFENLVVDKMKRKGMTREQAYEDIISTAGKTNKEVNKKLGLE